MGGSPPPPRRYALSVEDGDVRVVDDGSGDESESWNPARSWWLAAVTVIGLVVAVVLLVPAGRTNEQAPADSPEAVAVPDTTTTLPTSTTRAITTTSTPQATTTTVAATMTTVAGTSTTSQTSEAVDRYKCPVTEPIAEFQPPEPYAPSRAVDGMIWYGTSDLWTVLKLDGRHSPRKSVWWSANFPGGRDEPMPVISITWTRLDEQADIVRNGSRGTNAYTAADGQFMIGGIDPDLPGCWEVAASYKGATLSYVYVRT